jgi:hypothetical protein
MNALIISDPYSLKSFVVLMDEFGIEYDLVCKWDKTAEYISESGTYDFFVINDSIEGVTLSQMIRGVNGEYGGKKIVIFANKNNNDFFDAGYIDEGYYIMKKPFDYASLYVLLKKIIEDCRKC